MKHLIRPSLAALLLTVCLFGSLAGQVRGTSDASWVYLPIVTNGHPKPSVTPTGIPTSIPTASPSPTFVGTSTSTPTDTPTVTPTGTVTPNEAFRATAVPSARLVQVGQTVIVTATVFNEGSGVSFGLPRYTLRVESAPGVEQDQAQPILTPARPDPVTHSLGIAPGGSDSAVFTFQALRPGSVTFALSVSGEVCLIGPPGCAGGHWSGASARSLEVTVLESGATPPSTPAPSPSSMPTSTLPSVPTNTPVTATPTELAPDSGVVGNVALFPKSAVITTSTTPQMYVLILDLSGSMALNFLGQATVDGQTRQCGYGPDPTLNARRDQDAPYCQGSVPVWGIPSERRVAVEKSAAKQFIDRLGLNDRVALLPISVKDLLSTATPSFLLTDSAGKVALKKAIDAAASGNSDPLFPLGGSAGATALYRARQMLNDPSTPPKAPDGQIYRRNVIMLFDSVANYYLNINNGQYLSNGVTVGWENMAQDQPDCGVFVLDTPECQLGYAATTINSQLPRPITAMVSEGLKLQAQSVTVYVVAMAGAPAIGLIQTASQSYAPWFQRADAPADVASALITIAETDRNSTSVCWPTPDGGWVYRIDPANQPDLTGYPNVAPGTFGLVTLTDPGSGQTMYTTAISHSSVDQDGRLTYRFAQVQPGTYLLSAYVLYKGVDGVTRRYDLLLNSDQSLQAARTVVISAASQTLDPLWLVIGSTVCSEVTTAARNGPAALAERRVRPI